MGLFHLFYYFFLVPFVSAFYISGTVLVFSLYLYLLSRVLAEAAKEARTEAEIHKRKWRQAEQALDQEMEKYRKKRELEKIYEYEHGLEVAGTLTGGVAASPTPQEVSDGALEGRRHGPAKKGSSRRFMSKVTSLFPFTKSKRD